MMYSRVFRRFLEILLVALLLVSVLAVGAVGIVLAGLRGSAVLPADCAIVFGAAVHRDDRPGPGIRRRMDTAIRLLRQGSVQTLILTGGQGAGMDITEAAVMAEYGVQQGIDPNVLQLEPKARSTLENIQFTAPLVSGCSSVVAISDNYHLARILLLAHQQHQHLMTFPADHASGRRFFLLSVLREALGVLYYGLGIHRWVVLPEKASPSTAMLSW